MTFPRKGTRLITVSDVAYRWRIRHKPTYDQAIGVGPLTFAVQLADKPGQVLLASLPCQRPDSWLGEKTTTVRPALVAATIRKALDLGWSPNRNGSAMIMDLSDNDLAGLAETRLLL
ncbi:hypothetical protein [Acrocarpospora catenulata]|uniref:hypothetical protein n=1 Tax=Acrocarpospora catenulata TaxID=2836182 RepID=UPI001BD97232|nr:hypothetical protein [Acrocarpospora catenulata]